MSTFFFGKFNIDVYYMDIIFIFENDRYFLKNEENVVFFSVVVKDFESIFWFF